MIGVARDVRANPLTSDAPTSIIYVPMAQWPVRTASVVLRPASGAPPALTPTLQRVIGTLDARLAAGEVSAMGRVVETVTSPQSATSQMLLASAFIALVMAAVCRVRTALPARDNILHSATVPGVYTHVTLHSCKARGYI